jgi:hypothetical protein
MAIKFYFVSLFLMIACSSRAQEINAPISQNTGSTGYVNISGKIFNFIDGKPLAHATVFLDNTTTGTETNDNGIFTLNNLKPGKYTLIVSFIGFELYTEVISISGNNKLSDISLHPQNKTLQEVTIKSNNKRNQYYRWYDQEFLDEFLGVNEFAKRCKILNPDVLDFDYDEPSQQLSVSSDDFLKIENIDLGYSIKYMLKEFTFIRSESGDKDIHYEGDALFTLIQGSYALEKLWQKNRLIAYNGSNMHFLRAALITG